MQMFAPFIPSYYIYIRHGGCRIRPAPDLNQTDSFIDTGNDPFI